MLLFNRYEYNPQADFIGKGGFSKVYKAYDKKFQRWVALKIYKTSELAERYSPMAEIQRVINLDHPNICRYIDFEELEKEDSLGEKEKIQIGVMELLDGGNFAKYYRASNDLSVFRKLLIDVLHGLAYLHNKGIIHRDIKPANILIKETENGPVAKITDFGISKKSGSSNSGTSSALIVSIPYMAPEQLNVQKYGIDEKVSFNIDFWSLGVAVFEVITGELLFKNNDHDTSEQIMMNILSSDVPEKINQLPQPYKRFVEECLQKDAKQRVKRAEDLLSILNNYDADRESRQSILVVSSSVDPKIESEDRELGKVPEGDKKINMPLIPEEDPHISSEVQLDSIDETRILSRPIKEADSRQDPKVSESDNDLDETRILHKQGGNMELDSDSTKQEGDQDDNETRLLSKQGKEILLDNLTRKSDEPGKMDETEPIPDSLKQKQTTSFLKQRDGVVILFSRYEYAPDKDLIGKGGFSRVYRAFDNKLSRWVALKIYRVEDFTDRYSPIAEIKRVITFDHSNICRYLDIEEIEKRNLFGENETVQVCVMELLDGGNFSEYYKKNNNLEIFKKLLNDVFSGLSYLHKNGIIHRDIKPANILIKETIDGPVAKITDFGISKKSDSVNSESSSALIVSIPYMAPEQLNVKKYGLDEKIRYNLDLWSLGVTIYEVLTGNLLFKNSDNESSEQIMANIMAPELPEKINELPQPYRDIVLHCVVKNARDRAQKVEELMVLLNTSRLSSGGVSASAENRIADSVEGRGGSPIQTENIKTANPPNQNIQHTKKLPISVFVEDEQDRNRRGTGRDVSKPAVRLRQRREINLPVIVLSTVALLAIILFFYFRKDHATENVARNSADTLQKTNGLKIDSIVGAHVNQTIEESKPKVSELNKPVIDSVEKKKASPLPGPIHNESVIRNINKKDHPSIAPRVKKNLSEELLVKFTPDEACIIKIKNLNAGYLQDTEELGAHKVINVYLKPGKYVIVASSIRDSSKTRTFPFDVKSENVNQVVNYKISF